MKTLQLQIRPFWQSFRFLDVFVQNGSSPSDDVDQDDRARRAFVMEMMEAHPDAFLHEQDVQAMMHFYPSRF